ncbi:hypothetical protein NliqN6_3432 [Naganishia liquefaciens]|uniref:Uncharacterized protein n=1 Tax=Naganishia liquefaciens TaxID=104408 RepID=A0A8H3TUN6_9TREE|nr:hypothetical protein NliqN6_3432 [Naganishia liquefaciens]
MSRGFIAHLQKAHRDPQNEIHRLEAANARLMEQVVSQEHNIDDLERGKKAAIQDAVERIEALETLRERVAELESLFEEQAVEEVSSDRVVAADGNDVASAKDGARADTSLEEVPASGGNLDIHQKDLQLDSAYLIATSEEIPLALDSTRTRTGDKGSRSSTDTLDGHDGRCGDIIAGFLAGSYAFGSLARYSCVSRAVNETVVPVLYETVVWDASEDMRGSGIQSDVRGNFSLPAGWKWIRYLFLPQSYLAFLLVIAQQQSRDLPSYVSLLRAIFPDLRLHLAWKFYTVESIDGKDIAPRIHIERTLDMHGSISSSILYSLLTSLPLRMGALRDSDIQAMIYGTTSMKWHKNARILEGPSINPVHHYLTEPISGRSLRFGFGGSMTGNKKALKRVLGVLTERQGEASVNMEIQVCK